MEKEETTTIRVSLDMQSTLKRIKSDRGLKNMDEAIENYNKKEKKK